MQESSLTFLDIEVGSELQVPMTNNTISAGFPSPCQDYVENSIDLNKELIRHPSATFCARVAGNSMIDEGIEDGDILVIDRSINPSDGKIVVSFIDGEFTLKTLRIKPDGLWLEPANEAYPAIHIEDNNNFVIWGVVTYIIKKK